MNFVDFVFNCYTHIISHVSQVFASCTYYTSYSLLNIVHVIVCVFDLTNQVCKYFEFLCKTFLLLENLNFGKTGFKTLFLKNITSHTHAFCSSISMHFANCTHYTSYSLLNIVHVIMCVFSLTNQVCKYFEFLCKTILMLENLMENA